MKIQTSVIQRNIDTFQGPDEKEIKKLKTDEKKFVARNFIRIHNIEPLDPKDIIVPSKSVDSHVNDCRQADERTEFGLCDLWFSSQKCLFKRTSIIDVSSIFGFLDPLPLLVPPVLALKIASKLHFCYPPPYPSKETSFMDGP